MVERIVVAARRYKKKKEFAVVVNDQVFVGLLGGKCTFSDNWSKAKTFDDERKFEFFKKNFKDPIKVDV